MNRLNLVRRRWVFFSLVAMFSTALILLLSAHSASAQSIKIGKTIGGSGFHIPSYIAVDKGMLKAEGLNADFISAGAGVLVRAGIAKEIEFVPIPGGGAEAMLKGAPLAFIVGESLVSQWAIVTQPRIQAGGGVERKDHRS